MKELAMAIMSWLFVGVVSILIMIFGWGLEVKSWPIVIGGYIAISVLGAMLK